MGKDSVILKHHADVPFTHLHIVDEHVIKTELSALNGIKPGNHP